MPGRAGRIRGTLMLLTTNFVETIASLGSRESLSLRAIAELVSHIIPCERAVFTVVDFRRAKATWCDPLYHEDQEPRGDRLVHALAHHPATASYVGGRDDLTPRRV